MLRNVTFHYPVVDPRKGGAGTEEITNALRRAIAQDIAGKITVRGENFGGVRFGFADEVAVQWLPDVHSDVGVSELRRMTGALLALARFVQRAIGAHLAALPPGTVTGLP